MKKQFLKNITEMTTDLKDVLMDLDSKIAEVYDLDLAEEMSDIYVDLTDRVNELSRNYWKLVKSLAATEEDRDQIIKKHNETLRKYNGTLKQYNETSKKYNGTLKDVAKIIDEERKLRKKVEKERDQAEYDRDYYRNEIANLEK